MYLQERGDVQPKTYEQIARKFGVSKVEVCYHMALINRLPAEFVTWLEKSDDPEVLRVFTERRLRPIARIKARKKQVSAINTLYMHLPDTKKTEIK